MYKIILVIRNFKPITYRIILMLFLGLCSYNTYYNTILYPLYLYLSLIRNIKKNVPMEMYNTILINNLRTVTKKIKGITKQNKKGL